MLEINKLFKGIKFWVLKNVEQKFLFLHNRQKHPFILIPQHFEQNHKRILETFKIISIKN